MNITKPLIYTPPTDTILEFPAIKALSLSSQWVGFKLVHKPGKQKPDKIPYTVTLDTEALPASPTDPKSWTSFDQAMGYASAGLDGIGFVFADDPFTFIDLDNCRDVETGQIEAWAEDIVRDLNSYTEISISGRGLHILVVGSKPDGRCRQGNIEIYSSRRFCALTATHLPGTPNTINERQNELVALCERIFLPQLGEPSGLIAQESYRELSDEEVIRIASKAANSCKFQAYMRGEFFDKPSQSEAVQGLLCLLVFYTRDSNQIDRLFRRSGLYRESWIQKWQRVGAAEIEKALKLVKEHYSPKSAPTEQNEDLGNVRLVEKLISVFGEKNIIYTQESFWIWDEHIWRRVEDREIKQQLQSLLTQMSQPVTRAIVESVSELTKNHLYQPRHLFDVDRDGINCLSGRLLVSESSITLHPHDKFSYPTSVIPIRYDSTARAPRYEQFKREIFLGDADACEKSQLLDELLGYCLVRNVNLEKFFILIGSGANGKSVLLKLIESLLGKCNVSAISPSQFGNRFQRAHLQGKLANIVSELPEGAMLPDAELKAIVSGEALTAEHKGKDPFDFRPFAKIIFAANHLPHTRDFSEALMRRAEIVEFNNKFEGTSRDPDLSNKLEAELPGILNHALEGLKRLNSRKKFADCTSSRRAVSEWRNDVDQAIQFVDEACEKDSHSEIPVSALYKQYQNWCAENGISKQITRRKLVVRILQIVGGMRSRTKSERRIRGIRFREDWLESSVSFRYRPSIDDEEMDEQSLPEKAGCDSSSH